MTHISENTNDIRWVYPDASVIEPAEIPDDSGRASRLSAGAAVAEAVCIEQEADQHPQRFIEIRDAKNGGRIITGIAFVSPTPLTGDDEHWMKQMLTGSSPDGAKLMT